MVHQETICGIDVGNVSVKTVLAEYNRETSRLHILGVGQAPSQGLRRGVVIDMDELIHNIRDSVTQAKTMAGIDIERAYVSVSGLHIGTKLSRGVVIVSRADSEISSHDLDRVIDAASTVSLPQNREIIHRIPKTFIIDGQEHVKDPLGMKGLRLEAEVLLIEGLSPYIHNLARCINANEIEVAEFVYAPLALAKSVLDKYQREHGVLSIDFGGGTSSLSLFHEGDLVHTAILPIGSRHITNDLAVAFRIPMIKAELIKQYYGFVSQDESVKKESIDLSSILEETNAIVSKRQIARIVDARVSELFDMVTNELKKIPTNYVLPAGLVISGGGAHLNGLLAFAKDRLRLSTHLGNSFDIIQPEQFMDPSLAVAVGLVMWGSERLDRDRGSFLSRLLGLRSNQFRKATSWLKNFLP